MKNLIVLIFSLTCLNLFAQSTPKSFVKETKNFSDVVADTTDYQCEIDEISYEFSKMLFYYREFLIDHAHQINLNNLLSYSNPFINIISSGATLNNHNEILFRHINSDHQLKESLAAWFKIIVHSIGSSSIIGEIFGIEHVDQTALTRGSKFVDALISSSGFLMALEETTRDPGIQMKIKRGVKTFDAAISTGVNLALNIFVFSKILSIVKILTGVKWIKPLYNKVSSVFTKFLSPTLRNILGKVNVGALFATIGYKTYKSVIRHRSQMERFNEDPKEFFLSNQNSSSDHQKLIIAKVFEFMDKYNELANLDLNSNENTEKISKLDKDLEKLIGTLNNSSSREQMNILFRNLSNEINYVGAKRGIERLIQESEIDASKLTPFEQRLVINFHVHQAIKFFEETVENLNGVASNE